MQDSKALFLDLMKKCLTNYLLGETTAPIIKASKFQPVHKRFLINSLVGVNTLIRFLAGNKIELVRRYPFDPDKRQVGQDFPPHADTMIGLARLENIQNCIEEIIRHNIAGDLIETGVWRGGATIFMRAVLQAHNVKDRIVWVADSFEGLPRSDEQQYPQDTGDKHYTDSFLSVSLEQVKANFAKYGLLDEQVQFLKGWFKDTLPQAPCSKLAVMRLDGDMYESTMDALVHLYPKLSLGGFVIIDDYALAGCRQAVHDFRSRHNITDEIKTIDWTGIYWQRTK